MGIDALSRLIKMSPEIAEQHQLAVIDCLEVRNNYFQDFDMAILVYGAPECT